MSLGFFDCRDPLGSQTLHRPQRAFGGVSPQNEVRDRSDAP